MKKITLKTLGFICLMSVSTYFFPTRAQSAANGENEIHITASSSIDDIRRELAGMDIMVLDFKMKDGEFPTCDYMEHPEGCNGFSIINNEYVEGSFTISRKGEELYNSGEYVAKESGVRLKIRGNTSSYDGVAKKSYKVKLSKKADLLLRENSKAQDKDWVLLGSGSQKLNYVAGAEIGRVCGMSWEPEGCHVVVLMNDKYMGSYYLVEAVSAGKHRVNIEDSGFIIENDAYWWKPGEVYFKSDHQQYDLGWTFKEPDSDDLDETGLENIKSVVNTVENSLYADEEDLRDLIDYESFANWMLAHDIMNTIDGYGSNIFVMKKDYDPAAPFASKIEMGPLWDFDACLANNLPSHAVISGLSGFWYYKLWDREDFQEVYKKRWEEVRGCLKEKVLSKLSAYVESNPDVYNSRLIDRMFDLLGPVPLTKPSDDYRDIEKWIDDRIPILDKLIIADSGIKDIESINGGSNISKRSFTLDGLPADENSRGVIITIDENGKASKMIK